MGDDPESVRRKKLLFKAWHRGTREADLLLGPFAERYLAALDSGQLDRFDALLDRIDAEICDWIMGRDAPTASERNDVIDMLLKFHAMPR
ncbi:MAG: succinate dehydrogenase assembly factor 2 [Stellaceae bacterium]